MRPCYALMMTVLVLPVSISAQAHDPKEHMGNTERPDCAAIKGMDFSKSNNNDPVMQAIMKKCMGDDHHAEEPESKSGNPQSAGQ